MLLSKQKQSTFKKVAIIITSVIIIL